MSHSRLTQSPEAPEDRDPAHHTPAAPDERNAWIGMVATLVLCLAATIIYFWASGATGR